ncbi:MAG: hypothetical protein OXF02_05935, partial [Simkaniaceae bacterium]|nr:hypothetical protein [Simkaniaceae bacterium]
SKRRDQCNGKQAKNTREKRRIHGITRAESDPPPPASYSSDARPDTALPATRYSTPKERSETPGWNRLGGSRKERRVHRGRTLKKKEQARTRTGKTTTTPRREGRRG